MGVQISSHQVNYEHLVRILIFFSVLKIFENESGPMIMNIMDINYLYILEDLIFHFATAERRKSCDTCKFLREFLKFFLSFRLISMFFCKPVAGKGFPEISTSIFHYPLSTTFPETFRKLSGNFFNGNPWKSLMEIMEMTLSRINFDFHFWFMTAGTVLNQTKRNLFNSCSFPFLNWTINLLKFCSFSIFDPSLKIDA